MPRLGTHRVLAIGLVAAAVGLLLLCLLDVPYAGLLIFPFGAGVAFAAATLAAIQDVNEDQRGLAGGLLNTAMEIGPPLGLAVLVSLATTHSHHPSSGYAFALRIAAVALLITALFSASPRRTKKVKENTE
ncbi:MFS transporter [Streptomyces sp. NPDC001698]|uniref:MFS transporter n=1 Tax=unclassified Streptomyces TaxID=2593676 RepID=UPI0036B35317